MLTWVLVFLVVSIIAGLLGFTGISKVAAGFAQVIFFFFLILFLLSITLMLVHQ